MIDRPVLIVLISLVAVIIGALVGAWWRTQPSRRARSPPTRRPRSIRPGPQPHERAPPSTGRSAAHHGLPARLRGLGEAAREHATALRALHQAGVAPKGIKATADWQPPVELHADNTLRPGAIESWQALDRSFQGLLAALDDPDASFAHHAAAYETVATATDTITEALANATGTDLATGCSFCGKPRPQLRRLIAGPGVYVCDECVAAVRRDPRGRDRRALARGSRAATRRREPRRRVTTERPLRCRLPRL